MLLQQPDLPPHGGKSRADKAGSCAAMIVEQEQLTLPQVPRPGNKATHYAALAMMVFVAFILAAANQSYLV